MYVDKRKKAVGVEINKCKRGYWVLLNIAWKERLRYVKDQYAIIYILIKVNK